MSTFHDLADDKFQVDQKDQSFELLAQAPFDDGNPYRRIQANSLHAFEVADRIAQEIGGVELVPPVSNEERAFLRQFNAFLQHTSRLLGPELEEA